MEGLLFLSCILLITLCTLARGTESQLSSDNFSSTSPLSVTPLLRISVVPHNDSAEYESSENFPNPQKIPQACHRGTDSAWLCNQDEVLTDDDAEVLENLLGSLYNKTRACPCHHSFCDYSGLPMVVIVLKTLPFTSNQSVNDKKQKVHDLAESFLKTWKFDTCNDGAVTIVVSSERLAVTVIGNSSRTTFSNECLDHVKNKTTAFFQQDDLVEGLTLLIEQFRLIAEKEHLCSVGVDDDKEEDDNLRLRVVIPIIILFAAIIISAIIMAILLFFRRKKSVDIRTEVEIPLKEDQRNERPAA